MEGIVEGLVGRVGAVSELELVDNGIGVAGVAVAVVVVLAVVVVFVEF